MINSSSNSQVLHPENEKKTIKMLIPKKGAISKKRNSVTLLVPLIFKSSIYI